MKDEFTFELDVNNVTETNVAPKGWYPVVIEYGLSPLGESTTFQMCWRVKGTQHVFRIPLPLLYEHSKGDYEKHFSQVLETFRQDYLEWYKQGFREDWMQKYRRQFKQFIYTFD